ncbi:MAG TPA: biliverdin-producing heme oxygenase [Hyphomicrobiaceae bacterium]|nr:biliverdin-producing heme oxygenase [Hyphomicrobiaceae bacterium]
MSLRHKLREQTFEQHRALDTLVSNQGYFETLAGYGRWLEASLRFHTLVRDELANAAENTAILPAGFDRRIALLEQDLADLGITSRGALAAPTINPSDEIEILGTLYVTEGSALGAKVLAIRARTLGLTETNGARHLFDQAKDLSSWRIVRETLETVKLESDDEARMVAASCRTFEAAAKIYGDGR